MLRDIVRDLRWTVDEVAAADPSARSDRTDAGDSAPDRLHRALLTGLLGNIGNRMPDEPVYQGAHQQKFWIHPSSSLGRRTSTHPSGAGRIPRRRPRPGAPAAAKHQPGRAG